MQANQKPNGSRRSMAKTKSGNQRRSMYGDTANKESLGARSTDCHKPILIAAPTRNPGNATHLLVLACCAACAHQDFTQYQFRASGQRRRGHWQRAFHAPCQTLKELGSNQIHSFSPSDEEGSTRFIIRIGIPGPNKIRHENRVLHRNDSIISPQARKSLNHFIKRIFFGMADVI